MILDTLITDRSNSDVTRLKALMQKGGTLTPEEISTFLQNSKGAYNAADLNRVAEAVQYVANELRTVGEAVSVPMRQDWTEEEYISASQLQEYINSLKTIRNAVRISITNVPNTVRTVQDANAIEQMLLDVHDIIQRQLAFLYYSGEIFSGEV